MSTSPTPVPRDARLTGRLGPVAIVFMVVAAAAPLSVAAGTFPIGIAFGNGASFPASYAVCTAILLVFAVGFTAMARHVPEAGAFASYVTKGLGRGAGTGAAFLALVTYAVMQLAVIAFAGATTDDFIAGHGGPHIAWWIWSGVFLALVGVLGYRNIELSGKVLGVLLVAEILIVLVLDVVVVALGGGGEGLSTATLSPASFFDGAPGIALIFAFSGYIGFEATAIFRDEARDPDRTIPLATYAALLLTGGFYAISSWAVVSAWGTEGAAARAQADPATMVPETGTMVLGSATGDILQLLLVTSLFACILSFHNVLARYLFGQGQGVLPAALSRAHVRHASPHVASAVTTVAGFVLLAACRFIGLDPILQVFTWFAGVAVVGIMALMLMTGVAAVVFFRRHSSLVGPWRGIVAPAASVLGLGWLLAMSLENLPLLVGGSTRVAVILSGALLVTFVTGFVLSWARTHSVPDVTSQIGENA